MMTMLNHHDHNHKQSSIKVKEAKPCQRCSAWPAVSAWGRLGDKDNRGEDNDDCIDDLDLDLDDVQQRR